MSTTWYKFPVSYFKESRMFALRKKLGPEAVMIPARLWSFEAANGGTGNLSDYAPEDLADALEYKGDPAKLLAALTPSYIDKRGRIVGWEELFALAISRKAAAKKGAEGLWKKRKQALAAVSSEIEIDTRHSGERGDGHALRDALRDASPPPAWPDGLIPEQIEEIALDTRQSAEVVRLNWPVWRDKKVRFGDSFAADGFAGFRDYLRTERGLVRPGRTKTKTPPAPATTLSEEAVELAAAAARAEVLAKPEPEAGTLDHALWVEAKRGEATAR